MRKSLLLLLLLVFAFVSCSGERSSITKKSLKEDKDKISYTIGYDLGKKFTSDDIEINLKAFFKGIEDAVDKKDSFFEDSEMKKLMSEFRKDLMKKKRKKRDELTVKNLKEGEEFLKQNKTADGVITLPSGLQYKIIKEGTGVRPKATDRVVVNYRGTTLDGKEFDSSYKRGRPATFGLNQIIKGWSEALKLMKTGSKWKLFIPSKIAYGSKGDRNMGSNATLLFDIELLKIAAPSKNKKKPNFMNMRKPKMPVKKQQ